MKVSFKFGGICVAGSDNHEYRDNEKVNKTGHVNIKEMEGNAEYSPEELRNILSNSTDNMRTILRDAPDTIIKITNGIVDAVIKAKNNGL